MDDLNAGTKEIVSVNVEDRLGTLSDLSAYAVNFRVANEDGSDRIAWTAATNVVLMRVDCLLDTTVGPWPTGHYELYIRPTIGSERPILGPFDFDVV